MTNLSTDQVLRLLSLRLIGGTGDLMAYQLIGDAGLTVTRAFVDPDDNLVHFEVNHKGHQIDLHVISRMRKLHSGISYVIKFAPSKTIPGLHSLLSRSLSVDFVEKEPDRLHDSFQVRLDDIADGIIEELAELNKISTKRSQSTDI